MTEITDPNKLSTLISSFLSLFELSGRLWAIGSKVLRGFSSEGMYEVLDYETALEIHDPKGKKATLSKRMKVRYLQDNIIAFQDTYWAHGNVTGYRVSPGKPVDEHKSGYLTYVLISLRTVKNKGSIDEFNMQWSVLDGFKKQDGFWQTDVLNRMKRMKVALLFPIARHPRRVYLEEKNRKGSTELPADAFKRLPDGRLKVSWINESPKLFESYILRWDW
ncbi:MAG: hypothetical protein M1347_01725 [Chloroflexi bacterium]|nr:hypothetical protein [Chloroflexota bacterium]